jgi:hypothetical protein
MAFVARSLALVRPHRRFFEKNGYIFVFMLLF